MIYDGPKAWMEIYEKKNTNWKTVLELNKGHLYYFSNLFNMKFKRTFVNVNSKILITEIISE